MVDSSLSHRVSLMLLLALSAVPAVHAQDADPQQRRAFITVRVYPSAALTVNDQPTRSTGERRRFYSPPLEPGKHYSYTFVARWMPGNNYETWTITRKINVEAGKSIQVDLSKPNTKQGDQLFITYVPTPAKIVAAMMKLGGVGKNDVVYDLGCGDGRIVIAAVRDFTAQRGVGVDLDPKRLHEARRNAQRAGVEDLVELRQENVLRVKDLSNATVVMLYLSDDLNELLRPILEKQLKPGTRIVSHRFRMGSWKPDKTETHTLSDGLYKGTYHIHLWTIKKAK
ncbi:MAG TPA: TIGR03000 domain-containing protein [Gemmataceae bacterium]|nr:TIGR03000 domain-containing protein [Gemmataceae bacterium]